MAPLPRIVVALALTALLAPTAAAAAPSLAELTHALDPSVDPATLSSPDLRRIKNTRIAHHARYVDDARVLDQSLTVVSPPDGPVRSWGHLGEVTTVPRVVHLDDAHAAIEETWPGAEVGTLEAVLLPVPGDTTHHPVWEGLVLPPRALPLVVHIDGVDGSVLLAIPAGDHLDAPVNVYEHNVNHGEPVQALVTDLEDLTVLWTPAITVLEEGTEVPLEEPSGSYLFEPEDDRFALTSALYHLQDGTRWLFDRVPGMDGLETPSVAFVNVGIDNQMGEPSLAMNAFHSYIDRDDFTGHLFMFGEGGEVGGVTVTNFAHAADVVIHELGHGLVGDSVGFPPYSNRNHPEYRALHEGLADYGAAARLDYPVVADAAFGDFDRERDLSVVRVWPDDYDEAEGQHQNGRIIGSLGWTLRTDIGGPADTIMLGSPSYLGASDPGFAALVRGMLRTSEDAQDGRYHVALLMALEAHGLLPEGEGEAPRAVTDFDEPRGPRNKAVTVGVVGEDEDDDEILGALWELLNVPEGSAASIEGEQRFDSELTFTPDMCGDYRLRVKVADAGQLRSSWAYVTISACPKACSSSIAGADQTPSALLLLLGGAAALALRRRRLD